MYPFCLDALEVLRATTPSSPSERWVSGSVSPNLEAKPASSFAASFSDFGTSCISNSERFAPRHWSFIDLMESKSAVLKDFIRIGAAAFTCANVFIFASFHNENCWSEDKFCH